MESKDSPQSPEGRDGNRLRAIEPEPSFKTGYALQQTPLFSSKYSPEREIEEMPYLTNPRSSALSDTLSNTFRIWQSNTLHGTSRLENYAELDKSQSDHSVKLDDSLGAEFDPSTDQSSIGDDGNGVGTSAISVNFEANKLPPMITPKISLEAIAPLPGVISVEGESTEETSAYDQGIESKVNPVGVCYGMVRFRSNILVISSH